MDWKVVMELTKSEQIVIDKIRDVQFGSVTVKLKDGKIVHSEKTDSENH